MSYTYPEAVTALESIANEFMRVMRPRNPLKIMVQLDAVTGTASVWWDTWHAKINLPVRPASSRMTQDEFEDWVSFLLHELGHPTHTDLAVWNDACKRGLGRMTNVVEDVRMEQAVIKSNVAPNASKVLSRLVSRKIAEARASGWRPNSRKELGWTLCVLGRAANGYAIDPADIAWIKSQIHKGGTVDTVLAWALPELAACTSTADCLALAAKISQAIAVPQSPLGGFPGPVDAAGGGAGSEGSIPGNATGEAANAPEGQEGGEGKGGGGKGGGEGYGDGSTNDQDETPVSNETELAERELAPQGEALTGEAGRGEAKVVEILRDSAITSTPKGIINRTGESTGVVASRMRDMAARCSKQRALLARALRANETDEREGGRRAGRLDRHALTRAASGASNVFTRRDVTEGYDTDVHILIDASGSMRGRDLEAALEAGLIVAQAAGSVGASYTTEIFNSTGYMRAGDLAAKRMPKVGNFSGLANAAAGGTPLSTHMARAGIAQAKRAPHKRRVLFIITDGGCDFGTETVKKVGEYLEQTHGTVAAHVSIGTPLVGAFKAEVRVPFGQSIAETGLEHFTKVLQAL